ncbi:MAG TPA: TolC family protein [Terriglobales bacterium]
MVCKLVTQFVLIVSAVSTVFAEPLPFKTAIELAIRNSAQMEIAVSDQNKAYFGYVEARDQFIPQIYLGSGIAGSFGFPLGAPSIFNVSSQSLLYNPAARDFTKAAKTDFRAAQFNKDERRSQVILDAALTYAELDKLLSAVNLLQQQEGASLRVEDIVSQRIQAGIESQVEGTRAKLNTARIRLKLAEVRANIENLRIHLGALTGLPSANIETMTESIPALPAVSQEDDLVTKSVESSPLYKGALETADARAFRASGEHKQLRPAVDLVGQYALFSKYNNYEEFYRTFTRNNGAFGVQIRIPFLNRGQSAHAQQADADAVRARHEADTVKEQVSSEAIKLQRAVAQLDAAKEVARLEYQLARADTETVTAHVEAGTATLRDQEQARLAENDKYSAVLDATYDLEKGQMQLLRATGEIENWALSSH